MIKFTWQKIAKHNRPDDCWIVIDGHVYDVTSWVEDHPGGNIITLLAGEDASTIFHSYHLNDITPMLSRFLIGEVYDYEPDFRVINDRFFTTLKGRVRNYIKNQETDYRDTTLNKINIFFTSLLLFSSWACMYLVPGWGFLAAFPMGLATCSLIGSFGHEHIHSNLMNGQRAKGPLHQIRDDMLWGLFIPYMPERYFQYEHIKHHLYPMNPKHDYDVLALRNFVRLSTDLEHRSYHVFQHLYAPLVYGFYIFIQIVGGFTTSFFDKLHGLRDRKIILNGTCMVLVAFIFHIAIPVYMTSIWWVILCAGIYFFTWQSAIYISSGLPHMTNARALQGKSESWAYYVCSTTRNLKCGHWFFDWLTGGLNYHLAHHLLPSIPRQHLANVTKLVEETCNEFNYPYYTYESFIDYYKDHYRFLYETGRKESRAQQLNVCIDEGET